MRALFGGRRRRPFSSGSELGAYRNDLHERTQRIDARLAQVADDVDALRRRDLDPVEAVGRLSVHEEALDGESDELLEMLAPEDLHGLHMEYEANLERALRGIVTVERGCGITRLPPSAAGRRGAVHLLQARPRQRHARPDADERDRRRAPDVGAGSARRGNSRHPNGAHAPVLTGHGRRQPATRPQHLVVSSFSVPPVVWSRTEGAHTNHAMSPLRGRRHPGDRLA